MTLRCKKPRPLTREEKPFRDARLFIIATEDRYAPQEYFRLFKNPRVKVQVLPTEDTRSAPDHVLKRLDANTQFTRCDQVVARLRELLGSYSKRTVNAQHFPMSDIRQAVARAESIDKVTDSRWPQSTGTHVYKVVKKLL